MAAVIQTSLTLLLTPVLVKKTSYSISNFIFPSYTPTFPYLDTMTKQNEVAVSIGTTKTIDSFWNDKYYYLYGGLHDNETVYAEFKHHLWKK